jgi:NADH-quinone oxidoreductase subunit C
MAKKDEIVQKLRTMLPEDATCVDEAYRAGVIVAAQVPVAKLRDAASACDEAGFFLESITALDFKDTAELVYHFNCYEPKSRLAVRVLCGHDQVPPTLSDMFPSAMWQEREVHDFFGIRFVDNPDLRPLLLPEDADYHPLKKTFGSINAYHKREEIYG